MLRRIKRIRSYTGHAQFLADCSSYDAIGEIPRQADIPSPYAYSPDHQVLDYKGKPVIVVETSHKCYDVFAVPANMVQPVGSVGEQMQAQIVLPACAAADRFLSVPVV